MFPPPYEQALGDIEKLKQQLSPDTQLKAENAILTEFMKPETNRKLLDEVEKLGNAAIEVDQAFSRVSKELQIVDDNNYVDKFNKPVRKLQPEWDGYHERFKNLLWSSRDVATDTATYIQEFYQIFLPVIEDTVNNMENADSSERRSLIAEIQEDVKMFIHKQNPATAASSRESAAGMDPLTVAQLQSQEFLDLKSDISAFKDSFEYFADGTSEELKRFVKQASTDIQLLESEIERYTKIIQILAAALAVTGVATAVGGIAVWFTLGPMAAMGVLIAGGVAMVGELTALIAYLHTRSNTELALEEAKQRKQDLELQLETLEQLKSKLEEQTADITSICSKLDQFANIWGLVASDAREVNKQLNDLGNTRSYAFFKARLAVLKKSYAALYFGLKNYATTVTLPACES